MSTESISSNSNSNSNSNSSGIVLSPEQAQSVRDILNRGLQGPSGDHELHAWVFGSRATGHARPFSDLDLLIDAPQALDWCACADLADAFEASDFPFRVDVVEVSRLLPGIAPRVLTKRLPLM
jgi:predicted nucleotidyltransferase